MLSGYRGSVAASLRRLFETGTVGPLSETQLLERFVARGDEAAFEAIVVRHGPMVLGVCRRVLDNPHDVDDAFQATFLILVKRARTIRDRDVLGAWLYGVARRVAVRAKVQARKQNRRERGGVMGAEIGVSANPCRNEGVEAIELQRVIDTELERLPPRYRAPLILCDLEGYTHEQAATQLCCPVGTVKSRLSRGREQLRGRLARRGFAPSAALLASTLAAESASAGAVELRASTIRAAVAVAAGGNLAGGTFPPGVAALVKGVTRSMILSKFKFVSLAVPAFALSAACAWSLARPAAAPADDAGNKAGPAVINKSADRNVPKGAERFVLGNGLTVFLRPIKGAKEVSLVILYAIGSDHDPDGRSGLGHMVEHVYVTAAAGDAKARTVEELARRYPDGANGQTGYRYTVISTSFAPKDLDDELNDAAARMSDLRVTAEDLDRERDRLLEEVENMFGGIPPLGALNQAREHIRPTPGGGRHGGLPEHVRKITLDEVQAHWKRYYKPANAIIGLAGPIDAAAARKAIEARFGTLPAGEKLPTPRDPGPPKLGPTRELTAASVEPDAVPSACIAYAAPSPDSDLYAPFLVLVNRLWEGASKLSDDPMSMPVYFTPLDDGSVIALTVPVKPGETAARAVGRLEAFVAETLEPKLRADEAAAVREQFSFFLGTAEIPDDGLAQNPYGTVFTIGRRAQLNMDPARLERALRAVTERDVRRAAKEVFPPERHAAAVVTPKP
jgi:zinc protease